MPRPRNKDIFSAAAKRYQAIMQASLPVLAAPWSRAAALLLSVVKQDKKLLVCGNGGSATDSQHFAAEWVCRYKNDRRSLAAISLTADTSVLTAIGNDYGFENIFSRQVEGLGRRGDVLVGISTSGRSPNVLNALKQAHRQKMKTILMTGAAGARLKKLADVVVAVPSTETARIQEIHGLLIHAWCEWLDAQLIGQSKARRRSK